MEASSLVPEKEPTALFHRSFLLFTLKAWPVVAIATIGLCYLTQLVAGWLGFTLNEQENVTNVRAMFLRAFENWRIFGYCAINTALIIFVLPFFEELIFRGLLFRLPLAKLRLPHAFVFPFFLLLSSVLFSAAHYYTQPWPDNAFVALFFFGLAQCWLYRRTDRIWCPMLNHALFNLTNLVLMFFVPAS